jgi:hypothetical protein
LNVIGRESVVEVLERMLRGKVVKYISNKASEFFLKLFKKIKCRDYNCEGDGSVSLYGQFRTCFFFTFFTPCIAMYLLQIRPTNAHNLMF